MIESVTSFLTRHRFPLASSGRGIVDALRADMSAKFAGDASAWQDMTRTWLLPPEAPPKNERVIVIDAGGTNFRSCLVSFDADGRPTVSDFRKTAMPGVECELCKDDFFNTIADNIDYLKDKACRIGFCFSYSMTITEDGDGIPNAFSKEIKASEVVGCRVGATLAAVLRQRGWSGIEHIALLNDTVAALLAGAAGVDEGVHYSSFVGFILGTGMNGAYIQPQAHFGTRQVARQIVVCENGKFGGFTRSDFDKALDAKSQHPGDYQLEKCCSGAYLGALGLELLHTAATERLVSDGCAQNLLRLQQLSLRELDGFLHAPFCADTAVAVAPVAADDRAIVYELLDALIDRTAWYAANILTACVVQSQAGTDASRPVCLLCNGTTFHKTHKLRVRIESYLEQLLYRERGLAYEIVTKQDDITLGTAIAGLARIDAGT